MGKRHTFRTLIFFYKIRYTFVDLKHISGRGNKDVYLSWLNEWIALPLQTASGASGSDHLSCLASTLLIYSSYKYSSRFCNLYDRLCLQSSTIYICKLQSSMFANFNRLESRCINFDRLYTVRLHCLESTNIWRLQYIRYCKGSNFAKYCEFWKIQHLYWFVVSIIIHLFLKPNKQTRQRALVSVRIDKRIAEFVSWQLMKVE